MDTQGNLANMTLNASGTWQSPVPPVVADWVLVLDRPKG